MGKLSNILLKSLFFVAAEAQTFAVTSCNAAVSHHCLFQIADSTFLRIILQH